jgi:signal transduction histidine kinase
VSDVAGLLEHQLETGKVKVRRELSAQAPVVDGVEYKLQQVFLNLFLNARDAMPRGGWLAVSTKIESQAVIIEVADTGSGHSERAPGAHLRSVLHDQVHRAGHRSRAVDCIRHHP